MSAPFQDFTNREFTKPHPLRQQAGGAAMEADLAIHPSAETLKAFGLGALDNASAETVVSHLGNCADCRSKVAGQSGDDFLDRLRLAHGLSNTPAPVKSLAE